MTMTLHFQTLIRATQVVVSNELPYGNGRLEAIIICDGGKFHVHVTDGYNFRSSKYHLPSLKVAVTWAQKTVSA